MAVLTLYLLLLFVIAGAYVWWSDDPGRNRTEAVRRLGAFLWGASVGSFIGGLALVVGILWMTAGLTWQVLFNSTRFEPDSQTLKTYIMYPYDMMIHGILGTGSFRWWP